MKSLLVPLICATALLAGAARADGINAGLEIQDKVSLADMGLPAYPGAVPQREDSDDKASFGLNLWGGSFGIKLQVLKFHSDDGLDKVSDFYRGALARYGKVLDCSLTLPEDASSEAGAKAGENRKLALRCDREDRKDGKRVYKVGTDKNHFRLVSLQREGRGVNFQVVHLAVND
jgi:hypothetical protein